VGEKAKKKKRVNDHNSKQKRRREKHLPPTPKPGNQGNLGIRGHQPLGTGKGKVKERRSASGNLLKRQKLARR